MPVLQLGDMAADKGRGHNLQVGLEGALATGVGGYMMRSRGPFFFLATILLLTASGPARTDFIGLGGRESIAEGVSADGSVAVGRTLTSSGDFRAFRWTAASGMQDLGVLSSDMYSLAHGVSADGSIVVGESVAMGGNYRAFRTTPA